MTHDPHAHARLDGLEGRMLRIENETAVELAKQTPLLASLVEAVGEPANPITGKGATGLSRVASEWIDARRELTARRARWAQAGAWILRALGILATIVAMAAALSKLGVL